MAKAKQNLAELEDSIRKIEANTDDLKRVKTIKTGDLKKEVKYLDGKLTQLSTTFDDAGTLMKQRNEVKCQFDHLRVDRGTSFTSTMSLQSEITDMLKKLEVDRRTIHNENLTAETITKKMKECLEVDANSQKDNLEVLICKQKSHDEFLKFKTAPGKEKLLVLLQEKKEALKKKHSTNRLIAFDN